MSQKASRTDGGYCCPACGYATTEVSITTPYEKYISRKRHCVLCGYSHETIEVFMDSYALLQIANKVIKESVQV